MLVTGKCARVMIENGDLSSNTNAKIISQSLHKSPATHTLRYSTVGGACKRRNIVLTSMLLERFASSTIAHVHLSLLLCHLRTAAIWG